LCLRETPAGAFSTDYRCERDRHPPTPPKGGGVSVSLLYCWFERQSRKKSEKVSVQVSLLIERF
jgi:hypothetical protein